MDPSGKCPGLPFGRGRVMNRSPSGRRPDEAYGLSGVGLPAPFPAEVVDRRYRLRLVHVVHRPSGRPGRFSTEICYLEEKPKLTGVHDLVVFGHWMVATARAFAPAWHYYFGGIVVSYGCPQSFSDVGPG